MVVTRQKIIADAVRRKLSELKSDLVVDVVSETENAPIAVKDRWALLFLAVSRALDTVIDSLGDVTRLDCSFADTCLSQGLEADSLLSALRILSVRARERLIQAMGEDEEVALLIADQFFAAFRRLEAAVQPVAVAADQVRSNLEARALVARDLLHGRSVARPDHERYGHPRATYLVLAVHHGSVSGDRLTAGVRRAAETSDGQDLLPILDVVEPLLLAYVELRPPQQELKVSATNLLKALELEESPLVGVGVAVGPGSVAGAAAEATLAVRAAYDLARRHDVYTVDDIWRPVLLDRAPELTRVLAQRMAPLSAGDGYLLETLRMYLDGGGRRSQTAAALHIHPNTLDYRLRKIQEITGLNPQLPQDLETLSMALAAWTLPGDGRRPSGIR